MVEIITKVKKKLIYEKIQGFREEEIPMWKENESYAKGTITTMEYGLVL